MLHDETQRAETEEGGMEAEEATFVAVYKYFLATDKPSQCYPTCLRMCCDLILQHMCKHTKKSMGKNSIWLC